MNPYDALVTDGVFHNVLRLVTPGTPAYRTLQHARAYLRRQWPLVWREGNTLKGVC